MPEPIGWEGLNELRAKLKKIGDVDKSRQYKLAGFEVARDIVIPAAKANAATRMERRAAGTLEPLKTESGGAVRLGKGFPGALGAEFGADRNQRRRGRPHGKDAPVLGWNQFRAWKGNGSEAGYFMWPAIREQTDEIVNRYTQLIEDLWDEDGE